MNYENWYLIYNIRSKRLSFQKQAMDDKTHLTVGRVVDRVVNRKPVDYWVAKIAEQKSQAKVMKA